MTWHVGSTDPGWLQSRHGGLAGPRGPQGAGCTGTGLAPGVGVIVSIGLGGLSKVT